MSRESFLNRDKRKGTPSHRRSKKQENELATVLKGFRTPASGAKHMKGDVRVKSLLRVEAKTTKNKSFSVTLDMVSKIEEAALQSGEMPVIVVEFNDGMGNKVTELAVMPMYALLDIVEKLNE